MALIAEILVETLKVLAPVVSILIAASAILQNLERGRREFAANLIYGWAKDTDWVTDRAINVAKDLAEKTIGEINRKEASSIPSKHYAGVVSVLRAGFPEDDLPPKPTNAKREFDISAEHSQFIKFQWVRWLNRLEGTLAAWQQGAADLALMEAEFEPLVKGEQAVLEILTPVRKGLPVIEEFYEQVKQTGKIRVRPRLGIFPSRCLSA
jgi:hypothetical protein